MQVLFSVVVANYRDSAISNQTSVGNASTAAALYRYVYSGSIISAMWSGRLVLSI